MRLHNDPEVLLRADKDLPYDRVVRVLDHVKAAGLTRVSIALTP